MRLTAQQKKQVMLVILIVMILMIFSSLHSFLEGREQIRNGIVRGSTEEDVYEGTFVARTEDGTSQDVNITVYPRQLSEDQCQKLLEDAIEEFEQQYLGANSSADNVCKDLVFSDSFCQNMVTAVYDSDALDVVWEDGTVSTSDLDENGKLVTIKVTFTCQDIQMEYVCYVQVVLPELTKEQKQAESFVEAIAQEEEVSRTEERFVLPEVINGQKVSWRKQKDSQPAVFLLLGVVAVVCIIQKSKQDEQQKKQKREKTFTYEYPQMVTQLSLLMGAGMTLTTAWERLVKRYLEEQMSAEAIKPEKRLYMEEMLITYREVKEGKSIRRAYESFGNRIGLSSYRKLSVLLLQNLDRGTRDIVQMLDAEAGAAIEEQKRNVRRQGEEAGTKLLFPMLLLFLMILIVIMVPAMQSF